jgi:ATP-dependent helicase/nuclease subunit A
MVDRYCRLVCDEGVDPDVILAFTFTEKAASELRLRIAAELAVRAEAGSDRARAVRERIGAAWISTIHGFCNRVLGGHPVAAGIDPGFRVLDAPEADRAAREAFDEALEEFTAADEPSRLEIVAAYGIDGLRAIVAGVHAELRSRGIAEPRLPEPARPDVEAALRRTAEAARTTLEELKPTNSSRDLVEHALTVLERTGTPSLDELVALRTDSKAKPMAVYREAIDAAVARRAEAGEGGEAYRHLAALLEGFSARFAAVKERRTGLDFEDLQILAARLLERSEVGEAYRSRFSHVMVDEFQDTNRLQLRLIEALCGVRTELMVVGDELQSIYGFRHADLDVFRSERRAVEESPGAAAMELSGNFRSRPELIGAVNALGEKLLGESFHPLRVGAVPASEAPLGDGPAVELLLTAREGWDADGIELEPATDSGTPLACLAEARFVAERLRVLADAGVERGEMVVLLRAFTHLDAYEDSLERAGLRPYVVGGRAYWSQQQVADACALLATVANPLDDRALFGALASPACAVAPDTLWLLRAAAGRGRPVWPAVMRAAELGEPELADEARLAEIPEPELTLLRRFAATIEGLRARGTGLSIAGLIEAAIVETGYDLAVLTRPTGKARFANLRKLMRLAAEFETREGRDLRGFLDFLSARAEADGDAQAATAAEGHDGVRILTVHSAKGLEFGVVAVPDLSRGLLAGSRPPLLTVGREGDDPRVGMQLRRLGAASVNLYSYAELCEEAKRRDAEEGLRLFHVAVTRARERLILSGVVRPEPLRETKPGTPVIDRIVDGFGIGCDGDSSVPVPPPRPRAGLDRDFGTSQIAVRANFPTPERAADLRLRRREPDGEPAKAEGPAPLIEPALGAPAPRPLSYTAISAHEAEGPLAPCERVRTYARIPTITANGEDRDVADTREEGAGRGAAVHALLEWSQANEWGEPVEALVRRHALAAGLDPEQPGLIEELLEPVRAWLGSSLLRERVRQGEATVRAEVPLLLEVAGTVLRGSIDLLVEHDGAPPLIVDYKTDRLDGIPPADRAGHYGTQRDIYALAVAEARQAPLVEVAYVFLERPEEPVVDLLGPQEMEAGRTRLSESIRLIREGARAGIASGPRS